MGLNLYIMILFFLSLHLSPFLLVFFNLSYESPETVIRGSAGLGKGERAGRAEERGTRRLAPCLGRTRVIDSPGPRGVTCPSGTWWRR